MQHHSEIGVNRTGSLLTPSNVQAMEEIAGKAEETTSPDSVASMRGIAIQEASTVGSVPALADLSHDEEMEEDGVQAVLMDKLGERLAFERSGARLYEAFVAKCEQLDDADPALLDTLNHIRDEELQHFATLALTIESMGGDPTAQTPCADVSAVMSSGILQVITDPRTTLAQGLNALMVAELADHESWQSLIELARQAGHEELSEPFEEALAEEEEHLQAVRELLASAVQAQAMRTESIRTSGTKE